MKQTFFETVKGHKIEFNRLLNPVSYHILTKDIEVKGQTYSLAKDNKGFWKINETSDLPKWLSEAGSDLHRAILRNELSVENRFF